MGALQRTSRSDPSPSAGAGPARGARRAAGPCRAAAGGWWRSCSWGSCLVAAPQSQAKRRHDLDPEPDQKSPAGSGRCSAARLVRIVGLAVKAFEAIIKALFAPIAKFVTVALIGWLTAIPNFAQGNVAQLEQTIAAICGGVLGAVATMSVIRYWLAGFAGGGDSGFSALEGLVRTVGAALFIAIWPWLFEKAIGLTNLLSERDAGIGDNDARGREAVGGRTGRDGGRICLWDRPVLGDRRSPSPPACCSWDFC